MVEEDHNMLITDSQCDNTDNLTVSNVRFSREGPGDNFPEFHTSLMKNSGITIKVNENKVVEQELDDENRQSWFSRRRPNGFVVNEKEHIIYVLELTSFRHRGMCP